MIDILSTLDVQEISVLDHGYVRLVDCMPRLVEEGETADHAIADAARVSYKKGTKRTSTDKGLITTLMRERHTSPFEQVIFKFEIKLPIFVARQLLRHRTASLNEESARYSEASGDFYVPEEIRSQALLNKQSSVSGGLDPQAAEDSLILIRNSCNAAYANYQALLNSGVAREIARGVLPVNMYTSMVWTMDLHNLLHFLKLRTHEGAQLEIQKYAEAMLDLIRPLVPWTVEAWESYLQHSINLSEEELSLLVSFWKSKVSTENFSDFTSSVSSVRRKAQLQTIAEKFNDR